MGKFVTGYADVEPNGPNKWVTSHNQIFLDIDGSLSFVPRYEDTDGYSYPTGGRMSQWDIRSAIGHDFECKYHQRILIKLSIIELTRRKYLRTKYIDGKRMLICEDIPPEYLEVQDTTFIETNKRFKRMMQACNINSFWVNTMFLGVHLNINWRKTGKEKFNMEKIYEKNN